MNRQRWVTSSKIAVLLSLIVAGWFARKRFSPVEVGSVAPDFSATDLEGKSVRFADLKGEVVLLNVWATWCPPCRRELPSMQRLHERLGPEGLRIVAVSVDGADGFVGGTEKPGRIVKSFADELSLTFDIWLDPAGGVQDRYRVMGLPESFMIDRDGIIVSKKIGAEEWDSEANLESIRRLLDYYPECGTCQDD